MFDQSTNFPAFVYFGAFNRKRISNSHARITVRRNVDYDWVNFSKEGTKKEFLF